MTKQNSKKEEIQKEKKIDTVKVIYLILFLAVAGMVILYASDSFNSMPTAADTVGFNSAPETGLGNNPHAGADLNQLQRIKDLEAEYANTKSDATLLELGHLYNDSGFLDKAIETYKKYLVTNPRDAM